MLSAAPDPSPEGVSVVIAVYDGEATIAGVVARVRAHLATRATPCEVILVDDGSRDGSWTTLAGIARDHPDVTAIRLARNVGQQAALLCGLRRARHPVAVTMDDDSQHPPEQVGVLVDALAEGHDLVFGVPQRDRHHLGRSLAARTTKWVLERPLGVEHARAITSFRAFRTSLVESIPDTVGTSFSLDAVLLARASEVGVRAVDHHRRPAGRSGYTLPRLAVHSLNILTGSASLRPLLLLWGSAATSLLLGALLGALEVLAAATGTGASAALALAAVILLCTGAVLAGLALVGESALRAHRIALGQPSYVVRDVVGEADGAQIRTSTRSRRASDQRSG